MPQNKHRSLFFLFLAVFLLINSGCSVQKYLKEDQKIVRKNKINIDSESAIQQKNAISNDLQTLYKQPQTSAFSNWYYYKINDIKGDTSSFRKFIMRWSVEPSIFNQSQTDATAKSINNYMIQRGFFESQTGSEHKFEGYKAYVTYTNLPGPRYFVSNLIYESQDTAIKKILDANIRDSHLRPGRPVDQSLYELEVNRITRMLQNQGYANFFSNYISPLKGDSCDHVVDIELEILPQAGGLPHTKYTIGQINVFTNYDPQTPRASLITEDYKGINFLSTDGKHPIRPRALHNNIFLENGSLYSRNDYDKTLRRLGRLGAIKFVNVRPEQDLENPNILNYNIFLSPAPHIELNYAIEVNNSNTSIINQRSFGITGRVGLRHRNLFGGAENNSTNVSGGIELADTALGPGFINFFFRVSNDLLLPQFLDIPGVFYTLNKIRFGRWRPISDRFYNMLQDESNTRFTVGADFVSQRLFYSYTSLNFQYGYDMIIANRKRYSINQTGINFFTPRFADDFVERVLNNNEFLKRSLAKQLFTGLFFRDITFNYTSLTNRANETYTFLSNFESSGAEIALIGGLLGRPITMLRDSTEFSKFLRLDLDGRYTRVYNYKQSAAGRINIGAAMPFGSSTEVPFIKQFFVGGGLSIRAWQMRELGPGSYYDVDNPINPADRFQTGDFKFEMNGEYRHRLFWLLEGALFLDAGNVWLLKNDPQRPGAQLKWGNFISAMAVGTGAGIRVVSDFFIIRFDLGIKVKNPYKLNGSYLAQGRFRDLSNLNLAIGYSF